VIALRITPPAARHFPQFARRKEQQLVIVADHRDVSPSAGARTTAFAPSPAS
jgi:hypothetical protein